MGKKNLLLLTLFSMALTSCTIDNFFPSSSSIGDSSSEVSPDTTTSAESETDPTSSEEDSSSIVSSSDATTSESSSSSSSSEVSSSSSKSSSSSSSSASSSASSSDDGITTLPRTEIKQFYTDYTENNAYALDSSPTIGSAQILLVPIWFTDSSTYVKNKDNVRADIEAAYLGTEEETGWHSVKSYYETESDGLLYLDGKVSDWYETGETMSAFGSDGDKTTSLAKTVTDWYFTQNPSEKRSDFDCDGDGYIDSLVMIYAAPDYSALGDSSYDNLWAYCYWYQDTSEKNVRNPGVNTFFWASYDFMYGSSVARNRAGSSYYSGDTSHCAIDAHTFIHEFGHCMGLDDYYDYGKNRYSPAAGFSMQDHNVGGHDPYSVMAYGWADPYIPTESCSLEIGAFQTTKEVILLTPEWNEYDSPFDEYLLLELFTPTGLNELDCNDSYGGYGAGPSEVGLRVWHVDARLLYYEADEVADESRLTSDALKRCYYGVEHAFSNTYGNTNYGSALGSDYDDFDLLHLVRNSTSSSFKTRSSLSNRDLFRDGSSFSMSQYSKQFPKGTVLNNGLELGWSFSVEIFGTGENSTAVIHLIKE